jgi:hypothetical protein
MEALLRRGVYASVLTDASRSHDGDIVLDNNPDRAGSENGPGGKVVSLCNPVPDGDR